VPSWVDVFSSPDTAPRRSGSTALVPRFVEATAAAPRLSPDSAKAVASGATLCVATSTSIAVATPSRPVAMTAGRLMRRASHGLSAAPATTARLNGRNAIPVSVAPRPSVCCA
jgi:hypothetical protein